MDAYGLVGGLLILQTMEGYIWYAASWINLLTHGKALLSDKASDS